MNTAKPMTIRVRTCNCTAEYVPEGIIRYLLILQRPELKHLNTEPCTHWIDTSFTPLYKKEAPNE